MNLIQRLTKDLKPTQPAPRFLAYYWLGAVAVMTVIGVGLEVGFKHLILSAAAATLGGYAAVSGSSATHSQRAPWFAAAWGGSTLLFISSIFTETRLQPYSTDFISDFLGFLITSSGLTFLLAWITSRAAPPSHARFELYSVAGVAGIMTLAQTMAFTNTSAWVQFSFILTATTVGVVSFRKLFQSLHLNMLRSYSDILSACLNPPKLSAGQVAPQFALASPDSQVRSLEEFKGKKVWVAVLRYASCPLCMNFFYQMREQIRQLREQGVVVVAVYESDIGQFPKFQKWYSDLGIVALSDPNKTVHRSWGTEASWKNAFSLQALAAFISSQLAGFIQGRADGEFGQAPAHFLIEGSGKIRTAYYGRSIADHISGGALTQFAQS